MCSSRDFVSSAALNEIASVVSSKFWLLQAWPALKNTTRISKRGVARRERKREEFL